MPRVTFDTNIFISRPSVELPDSFYLSVVVLQELVAGAEDEAEVKALDSARREYKKPVGCLCQRVRIGGWRARSSKTLQRGLKSRRGGLTPKMAAVEKYGITNDVMIARTARRAGVTVVTDNLKDFELIQRFCHVRIMSGEDCFGS